MVDASELELVRGSKGGGKGKGGGGGSNADNTLRSKARARWVEIISEGPCVGLVDDKGNVLETQDEFGKGVYFEQTAVKNENESENFKNVLIQQRHGTPDQEHLTGFPQVETPFQVEVKVSRDIGPVTRTIMEENADAVRVIVRIPTLVKQDKKSGKLETTSVSYAIEVRPYGGGWQTAHIEDLRNQKTTSAVQRAHRIELPLGGHPWDIRVQRITPDSDEDTLVNETWFESYTVLVEGKFTYPNTALIAMEVNAEDMGSSIPARNYRYRGLIVKVPSNYDPIQRTYTGIWDGTFKMAWTNNPVWVFYDLLTNDRYGLGEFVSEQIVDKWSLYQIAQYCDQMIKSGFKNTVTGADIMEPRFTYNGVLKSREDAWRVLQQISTAWRGMAYWSLGQVFASADMPADPVKLFSPANVIGGEFSYSGTSEKARHSVALVSFNNPDDFYRPDVEPVINDESLQRYGWREKSVSLQGCTSRGLAHRYGDWILDVEQNETETVEFMASFDSTDVRPGNIIAIADPAKAQVRIGGRMKEAEAGQLWLDAPFKALPGATYSIYVTLPNGEVKLCPIASFANQLFDEAGESLGYDRVVLQTELDDVPLVDSMWVMRGTDVQPRQYRVLTLKENKKNEFKITALFHDPNKYARVENMRALQPVQYTRPKNEALPVENLKVTEVSYLEDGQAKSVLTLSWSNPRDFMTKEYEVAVLSPTSGYNKVGTTTNNSIDLNGLATGEYTFYVYAISHTSIRSQPAQIEYEIAGWHMSASPTVSDLKLDGSEDGEHFSGKNVPISWVNNFPESTSATADGATASNVRSPFYSFNTVKVYDQKTNTLLRTQTVEGTSFVYMFEMNAADAKLASLSNPTRALRFEVSVTDTLQRESVFASMQCDNPVPPAFNPNYIVHNEEIRLDWPALDDDDFAGVLVWAEETDDFDPYATTPRFDGMGGAYIFTGEPLKTYYFRVAAYDAFGKTDLNISPVIMAQTRAGIDMDPPDVPTGLTVTSTVNGQGIARIVVNWDKNTEEDMAAYDLQIKQGEGNWVSVPMADGPYEFDGVPALVYQFQVRARDKSNNPSAYSDIVTHIAAKDTVPPALPTDFTVTPGLTSLWLSWVNPSDPDLAYVEIFEAEVNDPLQAVSIAYSIGNSFPRTGLPNEVERFYFLRAVDTSGNASELTGSATAKTATLPQSKRIAVSGLVLTPNSPSVNKIAWTSFQAAVGAGSTPTIRTVTAGNATWTSAPLYLYYVEGETVVRTTTSISTMFGAGGLPLGVYRGGTDFQSADGKVMMDGNNLIAGTIGAQQLVANEAIITGSVQLGDAVVTSAKIVSVKAEQIEAQGILAGTVQVGGDTLQTIKDRAANPAGRINDGTTLIEPGRVKISNNGTVANWAMGGDSTEINGAALATGTVKAQAAVIGLRNITLGGLKFEHNAPAANRANWTAGSISYINDNGVPTTVNITAGSTGVWSTGTWFIYWVKDASTLSVTSNVATAFNANCIVLATYQGGEALNSTYGRTVIDGGNLKTDSVDTVHLKANSVKAGNIQVDTLDAISADLGDITGGSLNIASKFLVDRDGTVTIRSAATGARLLISNQLVSVYDGNNTLRVRLGIW